MQALTDTYSLVDAKGVGQPAARFLVLPRHVPLCASLLVGTRRRLYRRLYAAGLDTSSTTLRPSRAAPTPSCEGPCTAIRHKSRFLADTDLLARWQPNCAANVPRRRTKGGQAAEPSPTTLGGHGQAHQQLITTLELS